MLQVISVLGALAILLAYAANQFRLLGPADFSYALLNFADAFVFILLEVVWRW